MRKYGSQIRETLEEAGYIVLRRQGRNAVILAAGIDGKEELWGKHNDNPGYTIEVDGQGYEFIRSL